MEKPEKIGRSVARFRAAPNNAIFDCKVLSRNHALLWFENGKVSVDRLGNVISMRMQPRLGSIREI